MDKSVQVDNDFILVFGGWGKKTSFKFYPENNEIKKAEDMAESLWFRDCFEPIYDKTTKVVYAFDYYVARVHKFDQDEKWSIAIQDIEKSSISFE